MTKPMLASRDGWFTAIARLFRRRIEAARVGTNCVDFVHIWWKQR
jgi:hypothetical protein